MAPSPQHKVFWEVQRHQAEQHLQSLDHDISADTVVVGAGMAGIMCAQALKDMGQKVVVVERDVCGAGASGKTSGFITPDSELELSDLVRNYGPQEAKKLWDFVASGVDDIRCTIEQQKIDCDYQVQDSLFIANDDKGFDVVKHEHETRVSLGYESHLYSKDEVSKHIGSSQYTGGVTYSGTFGMNSYLFCQGMRDVLRSQGVAVYERTPVKRITGGTVLAGGSTIQAQNVVVCTDRFLPELNIAPKDIYHAQTFLSISNPLSDADVARMFPDQHLMVWDTDLIYQYFRITGDNRLLLGAASMFYTYDRKERKTPKRIIEKMNKYVAKKFPWLKIDIEYVWPGLIGVTKDFAPIVACDSVHSNVCYIGGAAGLPWAAALGSYVAQKIVKGRKDLDDMLKPNRKYPVPYAVQNVIGTRNTFALSHGFAKYFR